VYTASPVIPTTITQAVIDITLRGLEQTNELGYFRRVGGRHGFDVTTRWSTLENIKNT
jgi:hypothetical protein